MAKLDKIKIGNTIYQMSVAEGAVGTDELADGAVTLSKMADGITTPIYAAANAATNAAQRANTAAGVSENDHLVASADHITAGTDHTQAGTDHSTASSDHNQASSDHNTASTDHSTAQSDHQTSAAQQTTFATNEGASTDAASATGSRWARFNYSEASRNTTFASKEATRDAANAAALNCASELTELSQKVGDFPEGESASSQIADLAQKIDGVKIYQYQFNGTSSKAELKENIVLENNGDGIEFTLISNDYSSSSQDVYTFAKNPNHWSRIAIGLGSHTVSLRADGGEWLFDEIGDFVTHKISLLYENGKINMYIDGTLYKTYNGLKKVTISSFGNGGTSDSFWKGEIKGLSVNGQDYNLTNKSNLTDMNVTYEEYGSIDERVTDIENKLSLPIPKSKIVSGSFEDVITETGIINLVNQSSNVFSDEGGYYVAGDGEKTQLSHYKWLQFVAQNNMTIWFNSYNTDISGYDYMVGVYNNGVANTDNFVARYRADGSTNTLPTEENPLNLLQGQLFVVAYENLSSEGSFECGIEGMKGDKYFINNIFLNSQQVSQVLSSNKIKVIPNTNEYIIKMNGYDITLSKIENSSERANLWNITSVRKGVKNVLASGTDIVGVLRENGESDYMGGVHGDENVVYFHILADGKSVSGNIDCNQVDVLMYSHLTRVSSGENVIDKYVHIVFRDNYIEIDNTFKCLVDDFTLEQAYNGGMWAWYSNDVLFEMCNVSIFESKNKQDGYVIPMNKGIYNVQAIMTDCSVSVENMIGNQYESYIGEVFRYNETDRCKIYFGTDKNTTWGNGHVCYGKARYTLM